jgi:catechol 2,3-dioxygenase-like lactoylglutathione lyase family enzyme
MKRLHVHVSVDDLAPATRFYSTLFAAEPTVIKTDYAKWMLDDPRVNFAISARGREQVGLDHLGIQVEDEAELGEVYGRLRAAEGPLLEQGAVACCYHRSEKSWIADPTGIQWEAFLTRDETTVYGDGGFHAAQTAASCAPETPQVARGAAQPELPAAAACCVGQRPPPMSGRIEAS